MDADAQMLIKGMLEVNPARRLGNLKDGLSAVPGSVWYQATKFEWAALSARTAKAPYLPPVKDEKDTSNIDSMDDDDSVLKSIQCTLVDFS
jgi:cGMP-dependent protein kinase|tara:strand:- start:1229 stop:1501 length:273 start_codon:yes stop_codon:yes gene_type:complete